MVKQEIPSFFFPTTVMLIDDNLDFLKSIAMGLPTNNYSYSFYLDPIEALKELNDNHYENISSKGLIKLLDEEDLEHRTLDVNIRDLHKIMYNKNRFKNVSTVVVDYHMPGMNGIDFCKQIKNPNIQKILLTSIVDESEAIEVLNQGIIHKFIRKQALNVVELLEKSLQQSCYKYFLSLSNIINKVVEVAPDESAISDPSFIKLFHEVINKYSIVEYYLTELLGSFMMLDAKGQNYGLFTKVKDQVLSYCDLAEAEKAPFWVIEKIKKCEDILCYHHEKANMFPKGEVWEQYLYKADKIKGKDTNYYCAYGPHMFNIEQQNLLSFDNFLTPQQASI